MAQPQSYTQLGDAAVLKFLDLLVEENAIKKEEVSSYKQKYNSAEDLLDALLSLDPTRENVFFEIYSKTKGIPFVVLDKIDKSVFDLIDKETALKFGFVPFAIDTKAKILQVAICYPEKFKVLNANGLKLLENKIGLKIELFVATPSNVEKVLGDASDTKEGVQTTKYPKIDLSKVKISKSALSKIPFELAAKYKAIIFRKSPDNTLEVAAVDPSDKGLSEILSYAQKESGVKLRIFQADDSQISSILDKYKEILSDKSLEGDDEEIYGGNILFSEDQPTTPGSSNGSESKNTNIENPDLGKFLGKENITTEDIKGYANSGQVPQLVAGLIYQAVRERSSDIHIEPFEKAIRVRYRIDGELSDIILLPAKMISHIVARVKILSRLKLDEQRVPQDGRLEAVVNKEMIDVRVSTLPTVFGEKIVMRLLSKSKKMEKLEDLGFDGINFDRTVEAISKPYGVVLSTGPTGSGKTTSLYSILYRLNRPEVNIVTLEDPVEYEIAGINQTQIKPQIGFGFANGLRSILRQDPNIIMVGEIRDRETAELVVHAALTGHMVLSTLHTNDASSALPRLYDLGVEPFLITSALNVVIGQRLVRKICPKCRVEVTMPQSVMFEVKKEFEKIKFNQPVKFFRGKGCPECKDGFLGRVGIFEVLSMSNAIEDMVLLKKSADDIFTVATKEGMITMRQDGLIKAAKGITTVDEVLRVTAQIKEG